MVTPTIRSKSRILTHVAPLSYAFTPDTPPRSIPYPTSVAAVMEAMGDGLGTS